MSKAESEDKVTFYFDGHRYFHYLHFIEYDCLLQEHPRNLIPELLRLFYSLDWVTGTGGGISMRLK